MHLLTTVLIQWIYSAVTISLFCHRFLSALQCRSSLGNNLRIKSAIKQSIIIIKYSKACFKLERIAYIHEAFTLFFFLRWKNGGNVIC